MELLSKSWPFVLPALLPILALLHVPLAGKRGRTVWAAGLGVIALLFLVDILVFDHAFEHELKVPTVFGQNAQGEFELVVVDTVKAPAWHWHVVAIVYFGAIAVYSWLVRGRQPGAPRPVLRAVIVFVWAMAARLALEKTAAPVEIVWALGVTAALFAIAPFFGWYAGARGSGFGRFARDVVIANVLQRLVFVAVAYVVTTQALGTHLDVHTLKQITVPVRGRIEFADPFDAWAQAVAFPNLTFALLTTIVVALVLGALPWHLARRRAAPAVPPAA